MSAKRKKMMPAQPPPPAPSAPTAEESADAVNECGVCSEPLLENLQALKCGHVFHQACLDVWFAKQMHKDKNCLLICLVCKKPLQSVDDRIPLKVQLKKPDAPLGRNSGKQCRRRDCTEKSRWKTARIDVFRSVIRSLEASKNLLETEKQKAETSNQALMATIKENSTKILGLEKANLQLAAENEALKLERGGLNNGNGTSTRGNQNGGNQRIPYATGNARERLEGNGNGSNAVGEHGASHDVSLDHSGRMEMQPPPPPPLRVEFNFSCPDCFGTNMRRCNRTDCFDPHTLRARQTTYLRQEDGSFMPIYSIRNADANGVNGRDEGQEIGTNNIGTVPNIDDPRTNFHFR